MKTISKLSLIVCCLFVLVPVVASQNTVTSKWYVEGEATTEFRIPDILGYQTLVCDFHMHTVFSDGSVWPTVRVDEAWRENMDAIAITDHIEYQRYIDDIPKNLNRSYDVAKGSAKQRNILFPKGAEITRETPPGHFNAIFVDDIDELDTPDFFDVFEIAHQQGAFVFWNHPTWQGEERGRWDDTHTKLKENDWLHGVEVCNGQTYYPIAHQYAIEKGLTFMGTSDKHPPFNFKGRDVYDHRTVTLVFSEDRTLPDLKEALFAQRTAVWYKDQIIGRIEYLDALFHASVDFQTPFGQRENAYGMKVVNNSEFRFELQRTGEHGPQELTIPANATMILYFEVSEETDDITLSYNVKNMLIAPEKGLPVKITIDL